MTEQTATPKLEDITKQLADTETPIGRFAYRVNMLDQIEDSGSGVQAMYQHAIYDLLNGLDDAEKQGNHHQAEFIKKLAQTYAKKAGLKPEDLQEVYKKAEHAKEAKYMR